MLKETTGALDGAQIHDSQITSETRYLLCNANPLCERVEHFVKLNIKPVVCRYYTKHKTDLHDLEFIYFMKSSITFMHKQHIGFINMLPHRLELFYNQDEIKYNYAHIQCS